MHLTTRTAGVFRVLPDFLIIGAQRCGTTSLYDALRRHPGVRPARRKEVHYFDHRYHRGPLWYRSHFPTLMARVRSDLTATRWVTGEATPNYLFNADVPVRARALLPDVKLVVVLRNPVDRAYSHYHHEVRSGMEDRPFEQAIVEEPALLAREKNSPCGVDGLHHRHHAYVSRGQYAEQLDRWFRCFPREHLLILHSEELFRDPARVLPRVNRHIGAAEPLGGAAVEWPRSNHGRYADLAPATGARLAEHFAPHNERLSELLGEDFRWRP